MTLEEMNVWIEFAKSVFGNFNPNEFAGKEFTRNVDDFVSILKTSRRLADQYLAKLYLHAKGEVKLNEKEIIEVFDWQSYEYNFLEYGEENDMRRSKEKDTQAFVKLLVTFGYTMKDSAIVKRGGKGLKRKVGMTDFDPAKESVTFSIDDGDGMDYVSFSFEEFGEMYELFMNKRGK